MQAVPTASACSTNRERDPGEATSKGSSKRSKTSHGEDEEDDRIADLEIPGGGLKCTQHGVIFQLNLIMLILWRAYIGAIYSEFRVTSELSDAEKFDDVVFQYRNKSEKSWKSRLLQAKHKEGDILSGITKADLLSLKRDNDFDLLKYFQSFVNIKERCKENSVYSVFANNEIEDVILITNRKLKFGDDLKTYFVKVDETDKMLSIPEANHIKQYKLKITEKNDIINECKKNFEKNSKFNELIQLIIDRIKDSKVLENCGLIKYYYYPLIKDVFQVLESRKRKAEKSTEKNNDSKNDAEKDRTDSNRKYFLKFSVNFLDSTTLPEEVRKFREVLFEKVARTVLEGVKINISDGFAANFKPIENPTIETPAEFAEQICKILKGEGKSVTIDENCVDEDKLETFKRNVQMLGGHVLINRYSKIRFSTSFIRSEHHPGNLNDFRDELKDQYEGKFELISKFEFVIKIAGFKTCEEGALDRILPKPYDDADAVEFFEKLKLIVNYPNRHKLNAFLGKELKTEFKTLDCSAFSDIYQRYIYNWLAERMTTFYTVKRAKQLFEEIHNDVFLCSEMLGINESYFTNNSIEYKFKSDESIEKFLASKELRLDLIFENLELGRIRAVQSFQSIESDQLQKYRYKYGYLFLTSRQIFSPLRNFVKEEMESTITSLNENKDKWNLIVVDWEKEQSPERIEAFLKLIKAPSRKIIFIMSNTTPQEGSENNIPRKIGISDLTPESRNDLYKNGKINLQGEEIRLSGISKGKIAEKLIDSNTLVKLIMGKSVAVGKELCSNDSYNPAYYIERKICEIEIMDKIRNVKNFHDDLELESMEPPENQNRKKPVHFLEDKCGKLIWRKSIGPIENLKKYRYAGERNVDENTFLKNSRKCKTVIIADTAGMGKSTIISSLSSKLKETCSRVWVVRVDLNYYTEILKKSLNLKFSTSEEAVKFLFDLIQTNEATKFQTDLEKNLFMHCLLEGSEIEMALIFDGFDEISPAYKTIVLSLLTILQKTKFRLLLVTTRPYMQDEVEKELGILAHTIKPFSKSDQIEFLTKFWKNKLPDGDERRLNNYAKAVVEKQSKLFVDFWHTFTGIPLQLRMLAEILERECEQYLQSDFDEPTLLGKLNNVVDLYDEFVNRKIEIYSSKAEKNSCNTKVVEEREDLRELFELKHELMAAYAFLDLQDIKLFFSESEIKNIPKLIQGIQDGKQSHGIVDGVSDLRPKFIHQTFVEYFIARRLARMLLDPQPDAFYDFLFHSVLLLDKLKIARLFLDRGLENPILPVTNYLLNNLGKFLTQTKILVNACEDGLNNIVQLVCNCCKTNYPGLINTIIKKAETYEVVPIYHFRYRILSENIVILKLLVSEGYDLNNVHCPTENYSVDERYVTTVQNAFQTQNSKLCKWLLKPRQNDGAGASIVRIKIDVFYSVLTEALEARNFEFCKFLIEEKLVEFNNKIFNSIFMQSIEKHSYEVSKFLIRAGYVEATKTQHESLLHFAMESNNLEICKFLVKPVAEGGCGLSIDERRAEARTLTHRAAINFYRVDSYFFEWLIEQGLNFDETDPDGCSPLHYAINKYAGDIAKYLIKKGAKLVAPDDRYVQTALHMAVKHSDLEFIKFLIDSGCEINTTDIDNCTPLNIACKKGNFEIVKLLIEKGATKSTPKTGHNPTALHVAVENDDLKFCKSLPTDEINATNYENLTALHLACRNGNFEIVKYLIEQGADVNTKNAILYEIGRTKLGEARRSRNDKINATNCQNLTALHLACRKGNFEIVKYLIEQGADVNTKNTDTTILYEAVKKDDLDIVKYLIENGAEVNMQNADIKASHTTLLLGVACSIEVLIFLVQSGASINTKDSLGRTALYHAIQRNDFEIVKYLIENGAEVNTQHGYELETILQIAVHKCSLQIVEYLLEKGADVTIKNNRGNTVLYEAVKKDVWEKVKCLREYDDDYALFNDENIAPYGITIPARSLDIVECLLKKKADINEKNEDGRTVLHLAVEIGDMNFIKYLVENGANINAQCNNGRTPLHMAVSQYSLEIVEFLVEHCAANVNAKDFDDETPLFNAIESFELVKCLVDNGANVNVTNKRGETAFHRAVQEDFGIIQYAENNLEVLEYFIEKKVNVNAPDDMGNTALHWAVSKGPLLWVKYLVENGADIKQKNNRDETPLFFAVTNHDMNVVRYLIERGADVNAQSLNGDTPLLKAVKCVADTVYFAQNCLEIVKCLVENKADVNVTDADGQTPLLYAVMNHDLETVEYLIQNNADVNAQCKIGSNLCTVGDTPLHIISKAKHFYPDAYKEEVEEDSKFINYLIRDGYVNSQNVIPSAHPMQIMMVGNGADVNLKNESGETPLYSAVEMNDFGLVKHLVENHAEVNVQTKCGKTLLHVAFHNRSLAVFEYLIRNGANDIAENKIKCPRRKSF